MELPTIVSETNPILIHVPQIGEQVSSSSRRSSSSRSSSSPTEDEVLSSSRYGWEGPVVVVVIEVSLCVPCVGIGKRGEGFVMSEGKQVILPLCPT